MTQVIALKCPNCGAPLKRGQMNCEFCGAGLVLLPDGSSYRFRDESVCPNCGAIREKSSWFCVSCNTIFTNDTEMLTELQRKIRFVQDRAKEGLPSWMRKKLEPNEFIYLVVTVNGDNFYAVTDKRVIKNKNRKYEEHPLSEVVSVGDPETGWPKGFFDFFTLTPPTSHFEVNTFKGSMVFDEFGIGDQGTCFNLWINVHKALTNHNHRKKDYRSLILQLPLTARTTTTTSAHPVTSDRKYCVYCGSKMAHEGVFCPNCGKQQP